MTIAKISLRCILNKNWMLDQLLNGSMETKYCTMQHFIKQNSTFRIEYWMKYWNCFPRPLHIIHHGLYRAIGRYYQDKWPLSLFFSGIFSASPPPPSHIYWGSNVSILINNFFLMKTVFLAKHYRLVWFSLCHIILTVFFTKHLLKLSRLFPLFLDDH